MWIVFSLINILYYILIRNWKRKNQSELYKHSFINILNVYLVYYISADGSANVIHQIYVSYHIIISIIYGYDCLIWVMFFGPNLVAFFRIRTVSHSKNIELLFNCYYIFMKYLIYPTFSLLNRLNIQTS